MEEDAEKRVRAKCSGDLDRLSGLPDCLLCVILLHFPTKDVVKTSVLSRRWRNLWKCVPCLALGYGDFPEYKAFVSFVHRFLGFESDSKLQKFRLKSESLELKFDWERGEPDVARVIRWINTVLKRKVVHLHVLERKWHRYKNLEVPQTVYACESLVTLKLREVHLPDPSSVSLPRVKTIKMDSVVFANDRTFEMLISGCPCLLGLYVKRCPYENVKVFRVRSQSLLSFTFVGLDIPILSLTGHDDYVIEGGIEVAVDAPSLEYLRLGDQRVASFRLDNSSSLVEADIDTNFNLIVEETFDPNDLQKRNMIHNFLVGISRVKHMIIASSTLEVIYDYSRCEPLPLFRNLSSLRADFSIDYRWEMLPIFLESCTSLKYLSLDFCEYQLEHLYSVLPGPHCLLPTLEYVKIDNAMEGDVVAFMKLASYFLEKSIILKEFTFCLGGFSKKEEYVILKKLLAIPRLSSSCQVFLL